MRIERRTRDPAYDALGALFGVALLTAGGVAGLWLRLGLPRPICHFREWTGVPCPSCGTTRMFEALLAGNLVDAVLWNPLVFVGLTTVGLWAALSCARLAFGLPGWRVTLAPRERLGLRLAATAVLALGWAYLIWNGV